MARPCPLCGEEPRRIRTKYGIKRECCGLWSWSERPLVGSLTHEARKRAHAAFDPLWQDGHLTRDEAYKRLGAQLGLTRYECHMGKMDAPTANKVPAAVDRILEDLYPNGMP